MIKKQINVKKKTVLHFLVRLAKKTRILSTSKKQPGI